MSSKEISGLGDVAIEVLHLLLSYILTHSKDENFIPEDQLHSFLNSLRKDFPQERVPAILAPLLYSKHYQQQQETTFTVDLDFGASIHLQKVCVIVFSHTVVPCI